VNNVNKFLRLLGLAAAIFFALAWLAGYIDPPSQYDAERKAFRWAKDKAPLGAEVSYAGEHPFEETISGAVVRLHVSFPGERTPRFVAVSLRQRWRWWVVD